MAARTLRATVIRMSHDGRAPHLGSSLSCIDILVAAYWGCLRIDPARPHAPDRDRFILSKGHAAPALYATLAERGLVRAERGSGTVSVNGAAARKAVAGDLLIIATYAVMNEIELQSFEPDLVYVDSRNRIINHNKEIPIQAVA